MATSAEAFDNKLRQWKEYQNTPRSRLFYTISQANLSRHLPQSPQHLRILDAGCGNGVTAVAYAAQGHGVTMLDVSAEMLAEARRSAREAGVVDHIDFHHADIADIPTLFPKPTFDVVLCHNVAPYVDDASDMLEAICQPLRPNGLLSLSCANRYSEAYREALQQLDPWAAEEKLDA